MPIYEYQGQQYDISTDDPVLAKQKILTHLGVQDTPKPQVEETPQDREKTKWYEDIGGGLEEAGRTIGNVVGTVQGVFSSPEMQKENYKRMQRGRRAAKEHEETVDRGEIGKVIKVGAQIPAYLNPITAGPLIAGGGLETGLQLLDEGASSRTALAGMGADLGLNLAAMRLIGGFNIPGKISNALAQGGINVAQESLANRPVQNAIRTNADLPDLPEMTPGDYGAQFIPGAAIGAMTARPRTKAEASPPIEERGLPTQADLDSRVGTQSQYVADSIVKQIAKLRATQEKFAKNGSMSEAQFKVYQDLEEQVQAKFVELEQVQTKADKYKNQQKEPEPPLEDKIRDLDVGIEEKSTDLEVVHTPKQELVSPEEKTQGSMIEFSPDGKRVYLKDRARAEELYKKLGGKQRGSWTPFDGMEEPRPDDSDAPGIREPEPDLEGKSWGRDAEGNWEFKDSVDERTQIRDEVAAKWQRGKSESNEAYQNRIDELTNKELQRRKTLESQQPDEMDLTRAGILRPFVKKAEQRPPPKRHTVKSLEWELNRARSQLAAIERRVENDATGREGLAPIGKEAEGSANGRTVYTDKNGKKIVSFDSDQGKANGLVDKIGKLEEALAKAKRFENFLTASGNKQAIKNTSVKGTAKFAPKDSADQRTRTDPVFPDDADRYRQQLLNEGKSEGAAEAEVEKVFPSHPVFGQGRINKEGGMWTPFATTNDNADKNARTIASRNAEVSNIIDVTKRRPAEDLAKDLKLTQTMDSPDSTIQKGELEFFGRGQVVEANKRKWPVVWEIFKRINNRSNEQIQNERSWWSGNASKLAAKAFGPFMKLSHYKDPRTPEQVKMAATDADKVAIAEYMLEADRLRVNHLQKDSPDLTPNQVAIKEKFNSLSEFQKRGVAIFAEMIEKIRKTRGLPYLPGYVFHGRKGDLAVYIKSSFGDPAHLETFKSKMQADAFIKLAKERGYDVSDIVDLKSDKGTELAESFGLVRDVLTTFNDDPLRKRAINAILDDALAKTSKSVDIGKHKEHYTGLTGFAGSSLFKGRVANASDFFKSMEEFAALSASQHKKVSLVRDMNMFWDNDHGRWIRENFPNQTNIATKLIDQAMNQNQKYDWVSSVEHFSDKVDQVYTGMRRNVRAKFGKDPDLMYYPDVPILDRVTGLGAQLFYISALTTRPGFWAGQVLTAPFALRQFLKEGTVLDVMEAQGKGLATVMTGGDKAWKAFVKDMANKTHSLEPQFINEINEFPGLSRLHTNNLDTLVRVITGQKPSGMADATSRYMVAAMAFHHYKKMGFTGEQLASNVRNAVDNTMVMYDREHSPPIFNKMGLVGQNIAPLQKYGLAQLENLIGDLKFISQRPEGMSRIRASLPAISTLLTTMIMAGSVGLPLLMEYEALRAGIVAIFKVVDEDAEDYLPPSVLEWMLTSDKIANTLEAVGASPEMQEMASDIATHGVVSTATGYDIGSSLRFNPYVPGVDPKETLGSAVPVIKFMADMGSVAMTMARKHIAGDVTEAEDRNAKLKFQGFVGQRAVMDEMFYNASERDYVPGGQRGYAQVEQTPQEQIGQLIGSKPLETAKKNMAMQIEEKNDRKQAANKQKAVDLLVDGILSDNEDKKEKAFNLATRAGMTPDQLQEQVKAAMHERRTPRWNDRFQNRKGEVKSTQQKQRYERMERYE